MGCAALHPSDLCDNNKINNTGERVVVNAYQLLAFVEKLLLYIRPWSVNRGLAWLGFEHTIDEIAHVGRKPPE